MSADQDGKRSSEDKNGAAKTLLGEVLAAAKPGEGEQLALLPADDWPAELPDAGGSRRGRPPGSRNKATEELRAWARSRFGDPGLKLLELAFADPVELRTRLGADSAWDVQVKQAEWLGKLLPYFWALMPAELKLQTTRHLAVSISATPGGQAGDRELPLDPLQALLEFQGLSGLTDAQLHVSQSHAEPTSDDPSEG